MFKEELEYNTVDYLKKLLKWRVMAWRLQFATVNALTDDIHLIQEVIDEKTGKN